MSASKRGRVVNGDRFELRHPSLDLGQPFTSHVDVALHGVTHQVLAAADRRAFSYENTTGEFTVRGMAGHVIEMLDTVEGDAAHRYQGVITADSGALSTWTYGGVADLLELLGALRPTPTPLGMTIDPEPGIEITAPPRVALDCRLGILEVTPLTAEVSDVLPDWAGTPVAHGELYAGAFADSSPYLTLVTDTCRVIALPGAAVDIDLVAEAMAALDAHWRTN